MDCSLLRNIGIIAHIDAGKTTFSERILFYSDVIHRMGEVHEGAATMDFMPEEQERGITIASACITCLWRGHTINLVDTPGHVDFTVEVERCLRVLDAAVGIFCAVGGVEPQSETVWRQADDFGIPRLAVVNKMDRAGASFSMVLEAMRERLGANPLAVTIPLGEGEDFRGVLDLVRRERLVFDGASKGREIERAPFTPDEAALAAPWREALMDALTMEDDALLTQYLSGEEPAPESLDAALRSGTLARRFVPVFAASALRNIGVQPVLDAVCRYLPGPADIPPVRAVPVGDRKERPALRRHSGGKGGAPGAGGVQESGRIAPAVLEGETPTAPVCPDGEAPGGGSVPCGGSVPGVGAVFIAPDPAAPVCALAFKVQMSGGRKIVFLRLYAGTLREGDTLVNAGTGVRERVMRLYRLHADQRENLDQACAGDIVAVQGLKEAQTGDTLVGNGPLVLLESLRTWRPVISLAFEPKNVEEGERLDAALRNFGVEDPTLAVEMDEATGQRVVSGMGELQLEVLVDRMRRECGVAPRVGNPQVVCRETIGTAAEAQGEFDRELGGQAHYGLVSVRVAPRERASGIRVVFAPEAYAPGEWNAALVEAAEQGVYDACYSGPNGYAVEDVELTIAGLWRKQGLATAPGLHMAAQQAARSALEKAKSLVLEPLMRVDISVPESFLGSVIALLGARGARIEGLDDKAGQKHILALAPMRGLFGFATALRSASQGRAGLMMQFLRFDAV